MGGISHHARQTGQASIIAALVLPLLTTLCLGAVDAGQWLLQRQKLTEFSRVSALNIAARAAFNNDKTDSAIKADANQIANQLAASYFPDSDTRATAEIRNSRVLVRAKRDVDSLFLGAFIDKFKQVEVSYLAHADYSYQPGELDISFVVDVSGSMGNSLKSGSVGSRLARLQQVLLNLISDLPQSVALGLVPYHNPDGVNINGALWLTESYTQPLCVNGHGADSSPAAIVTQVFRDPGNVVVRTEPQREGPFLEPNCPSQPLLALSRDHTVLTQKIRQIPDGNSSTTYTGQGFIWGIRTLLENWRGRWNLEDLPRANKDAKKIMVLLTDGADSGVYAYDMEALINNGLCDQARAKGIDLWFIGFELEGFVATNQNHYYRRCFGKQFLTADSSAELAEAIDRVIASSATAQLRLVQSNN